MKRLFSVITVVVLCMALFAGCSQTPASNKTDWEYIQERGKLIVGLDDTFAPMGFRDEAGKLVGFDIDLATEVGKVLGVEIVFQPIDWNAKEQELKTKRIDCIWNGMSATTDRQESMSLSKKYLNNRIVVMALDPTVTIDSVDDMKNYKIGTQAESAALETMQKNAKWNEFKDQVTEYGTYDEAILDMETGRVQCIVVDQVLGEYKNSKRDADKKLSVCTFDFGDDFYAIGFRKADTELTGKVNAALQTLIDNGKAAEISNKWFGKNIVILEDYS